jgi:3-isopropylmalate/(R)-2-methylmalate dehydratase large subunit
MVRACKKLDPVFSDPDADHSAVHDIDLTALEPVIVIPPTPANTRNLTDYLGIEIHAGYLGSCASGRLEDIRMAAQVLSGRQVRSGFALNVIPTSNELMAAAAKEGLVSALVEAGHQMRGRSLIAMVQSTCLRLRRPTT